MEDGQQEEGLVCLHPPGPVRSSLGAERTALLAVAAATPAAGPGVLRLAPCGVMTLRPPRPPLCLLPLLLLLSGAASQADTGFETESPVRVLQVETLVRRLSLSGPRSRS